MRFPKVLNYSSKCLWYLVSTDIIKLLGVLLYTVDISNVLSCRQIHDRVQFWILDVFGMKTWEPIGSQSSLSLIWSWLLLLWKKCWHLMKIWYDMLVHLCIFISLVILCLNILGYTILFLPGIFSDQGYWATESIPKAYVCRIYKPIWVRQAWYSLWSWIKRCNIMLPCPFALLL